MRAWIASLLLATGAWAAETNSLGLPNPPKTDTPYIIHATTLVETETGEAVEQADKKETRYWVAGAGSSAKTPLAAPEFLFRSEKIDPTLLELYRFEQTNGRREILVQKKKKAMATPIVLDLFPVEEGLVKLRVDGSLSAGEYCFTPQGANSVFCFSVF